MRHSAVWLLVSGWLVGASGARADLQIIPFYEHRPNHDPNGIGKFYYGREIAHVMGHQGADWLERPEREVEEEPSRIMELIGLRPGLAVADIGAGSGFLTFKMLDKVGPAGKVYAVDIQPEMLAIIKQRAAKLDVQNIELVLGAIDDPKLPAGAIDLMLMVDVYHEFSHPYEMIRAMCRALSPRGRIVFVEYRKEDPTVPIKLVHKMTERQVMLEMQPHPLRWVGTVTTLPRQHIIIFENTSEPPALRKPPTE